MRSVRDNPSASRVRTLVVIALGLLLILFLSGSGIAQLYTDWLWFDNLQLGSVWQTIIGTRLAMAAIFTAIFFVILWSNLYLADRLAPDFRPITPEEELVARYHELVGDHAGKIRIGLSLLFALVAGANTSAHWRTWLLFRNGGDFGWTDPLFDRDAGYYVFRLPFWTFLVDTFFAVLLITLLISVLAHYLNGGIRASGGPSSRVSSAVKLHLSLLFAGLALLRAAAYYFDRFELVHNQRGDYVGALATDVEVQLPALNLLALISLFGAGLFIANIWRRGWGWPMVAVGLWAISHIVVGGIFPALYQRLRVDPEESVREAQYIGDNLDATRFAYGIDTDSLTTVQYDYRPGLNADDVENNADIISDISLVDRSLTAEAFAVTEAERQSYAFTSTLDIDRYDVDGDVEPVVLAVRNLNLDGVPEGWERQHVAFTHGYGVAVAAGDKTAAGGLPDYLVSGIGPGLRIEDGFSQTLDTPQVYFAEDLDGYAVVGATRDEVDYVAAGEVPFRYDGDGGVPMGSFVRRVAFSLRFQQLDPLISRFIDSDTEVIYNRDVEDRVRQLAPFLAFDEDPYPVIADGRIHWVIDAYTTTNNFPYSQNVQTNSLAPGDDLRSGYNYVRNSVKAVVDGYDGDVRFYVSDPDDPIIKAYDKAFGDLFSPIEEMPATLASHMRYPVDIFKVQSDMHASYQVEDPVQFLEGALSWKVAAQPTTDAGDNTATAEQPMEPQYRTTRLPGEDTMEFVLQRAFVPSSSGANGRPELTGVLVARSDGDNFGELVQYEMSGSQISAPELIDSDIRKDSDISEFVTLRTRQGSRVRFGEMQIVLLDETLFYVRPLYIQAEASSAVPELARVIVVSGSQIAMETSLERAIAAVQDGATPLPADPNADPGEDSGEPTEDIGPLGSRSIAELLQLAQDYLNAADLLEAQDDLDGAADLRAQAEAALEQLSTLLGVEDLPPATDSGEA